MMVEKSSKFASGQCISLPQLAELATAEIAETERAARAPDSEDSCEDFYKRVRSHEANVISAYKIACFLAKRTTDLGELCSIWKATAEICESTLKLMGSLRVSRPDCGSDQVYDLALDYRDAALKRYEQNVEAQKWQNTAIPAGLFADDV